MNVPRATPHPWLSPRLAVRTAVRFVAAPRVDVGKGQPKFLGVPPANRGAFDGKRVTFILRKDRTQKLRSNWHDDRTRDTTAPGGEVSQLSDTGHPSFFEEKQLRH